MLTVDGAPGGAVAWRLVLSAATPAGGTTALLPLAHERDWRSGKSVFPLVGGLFPGEPYRAMLRIYVFDEPPPGFSMNLTLLGSLQLFENIAGAVVTQFTRDGNDSSYPWYARVNLSGLLHVPQCRVGGYYCYGDLSLALTPSHGNIRYWALLSMTNNNTPNVLTDWTH